MYKKLIQKSTIKMNFYLGQDPFLPIDYEPQFTTSFMGTKTYQSSWGRGAGITAIDGTYFSVPISTASTSISASQPMVISRQVQLQILYYQVKKGKKRIVTGKILFPNAFQCHTLTNQGVLQMAIEASGVTQCPLNSLGTIASTYYQLNIIYQALPYMYLFNHFSFTELIYMLAFLLTGFITIGLGAFLYFIHRMMTRVPNPKYHGQSMLIAVVQPLLFGSFLGLFPVLMSVFLVYQWFMSGELGGLICSATPLTSPSILCLETIHDWGNKYTLDILRNGRKGLILVFIGWYCVYSYTLLVVPLWSDFDVQPDNVREFELLKKKQELKKKRKNRNKFKSEENNFMKNNEKSEENRDKKNDEKNDKMAEIKKNEEEEGMKSSRTSSVFHIRLSRRGNIMLLSMFIVMLLMTHMELSYSTPFQVNVYSFIVFFQIFYFIAEEILFKVTCSNVMVS